MATLVSDEETQTTVVEAAPPLVTKSAFNPRTNGLLVVAGLRAGAIGDQADLTGKLPTLFQGVTGVPTPGAASVSAMTV